MEMPGIEPGAFHMQSERATTALHPHIRLIVAITEKEIQVACICCLASKGPAKDEKFTSVTGLEPAILRSEV